MHGVTLAAAANSGWRNVGKEAIRQTISSGQVHLGGAVVAVAVQGVCAASVVGMVVGNGNSCQGELVLLQKLCNRLVRTRVNNERLLPVMQYPDVVVGQRGQGKQLHGVVVGSFNGKWVEQMSGQIINLAQWFDSPAGRYLQDWELARCDCATSDLFGYHALQIGAAHLPLLRNSRMQQRWLACTECEPAPAAHGQAALVLDSVALPFADNSLDLVLLPHTLEASANPHATLREVARVLVPEGRVLIIGFNPASLWGLQQGGRNLAQRMGARYKPFIPDVDDLIGYRRLRDWLQLLGLEVQAGQFGGYRPGLQSAKWFNRLHWLEAAGDRWWPYLGGVYFFQAIKRVCGMRMIQPRWKMARQAHNTAPAIQQHLNHTTEKH